MNSIELGSYALQGRPNDPSCSLIMESDNDMNELIIDLPNLTLFTSRGSSFERPRNVTLSSNIFE